ncbi:hypothetical protein ACET6X_13450 [Aeromonas veronii]
MTAQPTIQSNIQPSTTLHSLPALIEPAKRPRGRPPITFNNTFVRLWLLRQVKQEEVDEDDALPPLNSRHSIYSYAGWVNDVVTGAARLNNSEKYTGLPMSTSLVLKILLSLPTITNAAVKQWVAPWMGGPVSRQYVNQLTNAAIAAGKSIDYQLEKREVWDGNN